jgi:hypothetical protein
MDGQRFDAITRGLVATTRRGVLCGILATGLVGVSRLLRGSPVAAAPPECQTHSDCRGNRFCETSTGPSGRCQACRKESTVCKYDLGQAACCDNATQVCGETGCEDKSVTCVGDGSTCTNDADCCQDAQPLFCRCCANRCIAYGVLGTGACCTATNQCQQNPEGTVESHNGVCCDPNFLGTCVLAETCESAPAT